MIAQFILPMKTTYALRSSVPVPILGSWCIAVSVAMFVLEI